ncbi:MAG TPA: hypothetical protein P5230_00670 [Candidatus Magasanikbacteria bacterium]|nr:hypothetical protein [Candidatus Magasanikbacteria bacterium]
MKILHIIPSAFEYFGDIRKQAFALVENLGDLGFENYVFTLQYGVVGKRLETEIDQITKGKINFEKIQNQEDVDEKLAEADIIHLHVPFMGMGKKLAVYKEKNPQKKIVITVYQNLPYVDFFTIIIWLYNSWYLRKLFNLADFVCAENERVFKDCGGFSLLRDEKKFVPINDFINFIKENNPSLAGQFRGPEKNGPEIENALAYGELYRLLNGE